MERPVVTSHTYKGHQINLIPSREGYMWACQYVILKSDRHEVDGFAGNTTLHVKQPNLLPWKKPKR